MHRNGESWCASTKETWERWTVNCNRIGEDFMLRIAKGFHQVKDAKWRTTAFGKGSESSVVCRFLPSVSLRQTSFMYLFHVAMDLIYEYLLRRRDLLCHDGSSSEKERERRQRRRRDEAIYRYTERQNGQAS